VIGHHPVFGKHQSFVKLAFNLKAVEIQKLHVYRLRVFIIIAAFLSSGNMPIYRSRNLWYNQADSTDKGDFPMTINEYQVLAMTTLNPALSRRDVMINSVMGLCGEAGEAIDIVKKWHAQGHPLDKERLVKELGDVAWYLAEAATALDVKLEDVLSANIEKLKKRYPDGFETEKSLVRLEGDL